MRGLCGGAPPAREAEQAERHEQARAGLGDHRDAKSVNGFSAVEVPSMGR
jgi:hypothetical protein